MRFLTLALAGILASGGAWAQQAPVAISVDLGKTVGPYKPIYAWFGYDEANFTTGRDGKKLLRELRDPEPGAGAYPGASSADLRRRHAGTEMEFDQRLSRGCERQAGL